MGAVGMSDRVVVEGASPFHPGEQAMQQRAGVHRQMEEWGRQIVRPYLPQQHRDFYTQLPFLVVAARDTQARVWATLLTGAPGFISSPDPSTLSLATVPLAGDALADSLTAGADLGVLGIELHSRRRNRVNGTLTQVGRRGMTLEVGQTFGNCPQYITERQWREVAVDRTSARATRASVLDGNARAWIAAADTLFIASGYAKGRGAGDAQGMDASHRGGAPGFVQVLDERHLVIPDYAGNNHFNTVGNLLLDPRVGLLFVDFRRGDLLQVSGRAQIVDDGEVLEAHRGAQRLIVVEVEAVNRIEGVMPLRWSDGEASARDVRLVARRRESDDVTSFVFAADDGDREPLPAYQAGQHLPVDVLIDGRWESRTYTLSQAAGDGTYRISVKREPQGLVSRFLHEDLIEGDLVRTKAPAGDFVLRGGERPIVLVSAGVGITPMVAMLEALARSGDPRPVHFLHGARDGAHHPFALAVQALAEAHGNTSVTVRYSQPRTEDREGEHFTAPGRLDIALLRAANPALDGDFYLCGPAPFLAAMTAGLEALGVADDRIRFETF